MGGKRKTGYAINGVGRSTAAVCWRQAGLAGGLGGGDGRGVRTGEGGCTPSDVCLDISQPSVPTPTESSLANQSGNRASPAPRPKQTHTSHCETAQTKRASRSQRPGSAGSTTATLVLRRDERESEKGIHIMTRTCSAAKGRDITGGMPFKIGLGPNASLIPNQMTPIGTLTDKKARCSVLSIGAHTRDLDVDAQHTYFRHPGQQVVF